MNITKARIVVFSTAMLLSACASDGVKDETNAGVLIEKAKQTFEKVDAVGFAWRDVKDMIKEAEVALIDAETNKAIELAKEAIMQNELAMQQYAREKNAGPL